MSTQNSDGVQITGGYIHNLGAGTNPHATGLHVATNAQFMAGIYLAGRIINTGDLLLESAIADGTILARVGANEVISGAWTVNAIWTFNSNVHINGNLRILPDVNAFANYMSIGDGATASCPVYVQAGEAGVNGGNALISNNYYSPNGGASGWRVPGQGGSFIRLGRNGIDIIGFDSNGVQTAFINAIPTGVSITPPTNLYGHNMFFHGADGIQMGPQFMVSGTRRGQVVCYNQAMYYDGASHNIRNVAQQNLVTIDASGAMASASSITAGTHVRAGSGSYLKNDGSLGLAMAGASWQAFGDVFYFTNQGNTFHRMTLSDVGSFELHQASAQICVGGARGAGLCISKNSGPGVAFYCHAPGAITEFHNQTGGVKAFSFSDANVAVHVGTFFYPEGSAASPGLACITNGKAGIYYSWGNPTLEFGCRFDDNGGRASVRAYANQPLIDFMAASVVPMEIWSSAGVGRVRIGQDGHLTHMWHYGHDYPATHHAYQSGLAANAWAAVHSAAFVNTSDIRMKDVHGPIVNALDLLDEVNPIIASWKEEIRPEFRKDDSTWGNKFPAFSAQEIAEKLDAKYGTHVTVHDEEMDSWGTDYSRLVPVLWQMLRELKARVKALEP